MRTAAAILSAFALSGCSGIVITGLTVSYQKGDETVSGTAHFQLSGKEPANAK